jgi:predicted DNA-binding protein
MRNKAVCSFTLWPETHDELKSTARAMGISASAIVQHAIEDWLKHPYLTADPTLGLTRDELRELARQALESEDHGSR